MTNIHEIEKEIIQLQENIEAALVDLQAKPRGMLAKFAKLTRFEDEILGPNKDLTNIDTEIKEAEEFLSEDQINIIRSIVTIDDTHAATEATAVSTTASKAPVDKTADTLDNAKWDNLRPTLRSLGLVRERDVVSASTSLNASTEEDTDLDSDDDEEDDENDESDDENEENPNEEDEEEDDNDDHDNDIDLASIQKRRRKFRRKIRRQKRLRMQQKQNAIAAKSSATTSAAVSADKSGEEIQIISTVPASDSAVIILDDVNTVVAPKNPDLAAVTAPTSTSEQSRQRTSASISKLTEPPAASSEKLPG